jgi:DNA-binding transcriptional MerR regulator
MSSRTYLSIGDVLGLLRQEFPDVTISKIRFLESQGLVNPERTPSGYRKFYDNDVERLRWVLRQQREHFLPLKVIKGRLEEDVPEDGDGAADDGGLKRDDDAAAAAARSGPALAAHRPAGAGEARRGPGAVARPDGPSAARRAGRSPSVTGPGSTHPSGHLAAHARTSGVGTVGGRGAVVSSSAADTERTTRAEPGEWRTRARAGQGPPAAESGETGPSPLPTLPGDSVTAEELAEAGGLDAGALAQLESYGLLCGRVVGGVTYFDEDAVAVARLAAAFAQYGVEARHLRLHKNAADREAGFIEQIVLPVLRQRNPEARQRALETVAELSRLGQGLREVLLRVALRNQLGG